MQKDIEVEILCCEVRGDDLKPGWWEVQAAKEYGTTLQAGANIAGFLKVADAMLAQGVV